MNSEQPQDPPYAVQIELTEGCTLTCEFCGVNGIRDRSGGFKFMTLAHVHAIALRLRDAMKEHKWNPRIEFAMHGEPSMHPHLEQAVAIIRNEVGPKTSMVMFSNGAGFAKDPSRIDRVLEAGINTIGFDAYEHVNTVPSLISRYTGTAPIFHYPEQREHNLHSGRRTGRKDVVIIKDISVADAGNHSTLNTHCGGGMKPPVEVTSGRCAKPFRELAIRWDGNVALCCNDFRGIYKVANAVTTPLQELWDHQHFVSARRMLMKGDRGFAPCKWCNAKSMRVGLLPDKFGKVTLQDPTGLDLAVLAHATAGNPYTRPVFREWERDNPMIPAHAVSGQYVLTFIDSKKLAKLREEEAAK